MFSKILVANRGEIAVRIIKACRTIGVTAIAVYSEADKTALHVVEADDAEYIGPATPGESYLNIDRIIAAARKHGCEAIHPGYGFLAENADFARRCLEEGLKFIGPAHDAILLLGNKVASRNRVAEAGVPVTPGMKSSTHDVDTFLKTAEEVGYPVLIKASAGGGGKGMRVVRNPEDMAAAVDAARRESKGAFADDTVYLEKFIEKPRHIEFQILADEHGNVIHLLERECSIQRRHQKIVEESPSTAIDDELRTRMGKAAVAVAKAAGYTNAGTVEFLLDQDRNFYFLEVNTRIQVEHPVTELITGHDLVAAQLRIASGEKLWLRQEDIRSTGHAIECRIYAEDPANNFFPSPGKILAYREPHGPGVRLDNGVFAGYTVPFEYDPILAKLITFGSTRDEAIARMINALSEYVVLGIQTSIPFLRELVDHPAFRGGDLHTGFIEEHFDGYVCEFDEKLLPKALLAATFADGRRSGTAGARPGGTAGGPMQAHNPWLEVGSWTVGNR